MIMVLGIPIVLFAALCITILITIVGIVYRIIELKCCTEKVEAVCVDIQSKFTRNRKTIYTPTWEYPYDGRYYRVKSKNGNSVVKYRIGEKTTLFINPEKPAQYRAEFFSDAVLTIIIGAVMTLALFLMTLLV